MNRLYLGIALIVLGLTILVSPLSRPVDCNALYEQMMNTDNHATDVSASMKQMQAAADALQKAGCLNTDSHAAAGAR